MSDSELSIGSELSEEDKIKEEEDQLPSEIESSIEPSSPSSLDAPSPPPQQIDPPPIQPPPPQPKPPQPS